MKPVWPHQAKGYALQARGTHINMLDEFQRSGHLLDVTGTMMLFGRSYFPSGLLAPRKSLDTCPTIISVATLGPVVLSLPKHASSVRG